MGNNKNTTQKDANHDERKIPVTMVALVTIALLVGCAGVPKVSKPVLLRQSVLQERNLPEPTVEVLIQIWRP